MLCAMVDELDGSYELDRNRIARAFQKVGMLDFWKQSLPKCEIKLSERRGYSILQWKLLRCFRKMLEDELYQYKLEQETQGKFIKTYGLSLKQEVNNYPDISEHVFCEWAMRVGINHLYAVSRGSNIQDYMGRIIQDDPGLRVYERFDSILHLLT